MTIQQIPKGIFVSDLIQAKKEVSKWQLGIQED